MCHLFGSRFQAAAPPLCLAVALQKSARGCDEGTYPVDERPQRRILPLNLFSELVRRVVWVVHTGDLVQNADLNIT